MSGGVDSAVSAYILKKKGYLVEAVYMNNWDARMEEGSNCTLSEDIKSIEMTCKQLQIHKIHHVNYQSSYWQRVFSPVLSGYQGGLMTPNPDILCNREIKFGELYRWAVEGEGNGEFLATGHYARITQHNEVSLRQAKDLTKDQTYFLAAINRNCLKRTIFPIGSILKSQVKSQLVQEAGLDHLIGRRESMGLCFIGKRDKFQNLINGFLPDIPSAGPIINYETSTEIAKHKGLSHYTIGQNVAISGAKRKFYLVKKDRENNSLLVVGAQSHPALWSKALKVAGVDFHLMLETDEIIYCTIRSVDKLGTRVKSITRESTFITIELEESVYAPCSGQWAVFYIEDRFALENGRICIGAGQIID